MQIVYPNSANSANSAKLYDEKRLPAVAIEVSGSVASSSVASGSRHPPTPPTPGKAWPREKGRSACRRLISFCFPVSVLPQQGVAMFGPVLDQFGISFGPDFRMVWSRFGSKAFQRR